MGRNKIAIQKIENEKLRNIAYFKRKKGLLKKAMELSILCDADILLGIYPTNISNNKLILFCSKNNIDNFIDKYYRNPLIEKIMYGLKDVSLKIIINI